MVRVVEEPIMDNREEIFDALNDFEKKPAKEIPPLLEQFLRQVAKTGETLFPWPRLKPLFVSKLTQVMTQFHQEIAVDAFPPNINMEQVKFDDMRDRIITAIERFHGAPFTIQRLCELITEPKRHYKRSDKFLRGIERNVLVVSTVDPFGRKVVSESRNLVNGLDTNGCQQTSNLPPPPVPNWALNNPSPTSIWPQSVTHPDQEEQVHPNGDEDYHEMQEAPFQGQTFEQGEQCEDRPLEQDQNTTQEDQTTESSDNPLSSGQTEEALRSDTEVTSTDLHSGDTDQSEAAQHDRDENGSGEATPLEHHEKEDNDEPPQKMRKTEEEEKGEEVVSDSTPLPDVSPAEPVDASIKSESLDKTEEAESMPAVSESSNVSSSDVNPPSSEHDVQDPSVAESLPASSDDSPSSSDTPSKEAEADTKTEDCASSDSVKRDNDEQVISNSEQCTEQTPSVQETNTSNSCESSDQVDSSEQVMHTETDSSRTQVEKEEETLPDQPDPTAVSQSEEPMDQD